MGGGACQAAVFASLRGCHASCASLGDRTTCLAGACLLLLSFSLSASLSLSFPLSLLRAVKSNPALNAAVKMTLGRELEQLKRAVLQGQGESSTSGEAEACHPGGLRFQQRSHCSSGRAPFWAAWLWQNPACKGRSSLQRLSHHARVLVDALQATANQSGANFIAVKDTAQLIPVSSLIPFSFRSAALDSASSFTVSNLSRLDRSQLGHVQSFYM